MRLYILFVCLMFGRKEYDRFCNRRGINRYRIIYFCCELYNNILYIYIYNNTEINVIGLLIRYGDVFIFRFDAKTDSDHNCAGLDGRCPTIV